MRRILFGAVIPDLEAPLTYRLALLNTLTSPSAVSPWGWLWGASCRCCSASRLCASDALSSGRSTRSSGSSSFCRSSGSTRSAACWRSASRTLAFSRRSTPRSCRSRTAAPGRDCRPRGGSLASPTAYCPWCSLTSRTTRLPLRMRPVLFRHSRVHRPADAGVSPGNGLPRGALLRGRDPGAPGHLHSGILHRQRHRRRQARQGDVSHPHHGTAEHGDRHYIPAGATAPAPLLRDGPDDPGVSGRCFRPVPAD